MRLDGFSSGTNGDYASILSDGRELRLGEVAVFVVCVVSSLSSGFRRCERSDILGLLICFCNTGLLIAAPLLVGIFPGFLVALWELATVLGLDGDELRTVLSLVSLLVAMVATSAEDELALGSESTWRSLPLASTC